MLSLAFSRAELSVTWQTLAAGRTAQLKSKSLRRALFFRDRGGRTRGCYHGAPRGALRVPEASCPKRQKFPRRDRFLDSQLKKLPTVVVGDVAQDLRLADTAFAHSQRTQLVLH